MQNLTLVKEQIEERPTTMNEDRSRGLGRGRGSFNCHETGHFKRNCLQILRNRDWEGKDKADKSATSLNYKALTNKVKGQPSKTALEASQDEKVVYMV